MHRPLLTVAALLILTACQAPPSAKTVTEVKALTDATETRTYRFQSSEFPEAKGRLVVRIQGEDRAQSRLKFHKEDRLLRTEIVDFEKEETKFRRRMVKRGLSLELDRTAVSNGGMLYLSGGFARGGVERLFGTGTESLFRLDALRFDGATAQEFVATGFKPGASFEFRIYSDTTEYWLNRRYFVGEKEVFVDQNGRYQTAYRIRYEDMDPEWRRRQARQEDDEAIAERLPETKSGKLLKEILTRGPKEAQFSETGEILVDENGKVLRFQRTFQTRRQSITQSGELIGAY